MALKKIPTAIKRTTGINGKKVSVNNTFIINGAATITKIAIGATINTTISDC